MDQNLSVTALPLKIECTAVNTHFTVEDSYVRQKQTLLMLDVILSLGIITSQLLYRTTHLNDGEIEVNANSSICNLDWLRAFYGCSELNSIEIPQELTSIKALLLMDDKFTSV